MNSKKCNQDITHSQGGGIPNYLLNIDDMVGIIKDALIPDIESMDNKPIQRSKGFYIESSDIGVKAVTWNPLYDIEIVGLNFTQGEVRNMGYEDYFNIYIDDEILAETVYLKEIQEKKRFRAYRKVSKGSNIKIEYINNTGISKEFKIDIEYIGYGKIEPPTITPPLVEIEPPIELLPIYRVYMRYQDNIKTDLDIYANLFNNDDGSDIKPSRTVGFSRRVWGLDNDNKAVVERVSDDNLGINDREDNPEIIEIFGKPSRHFRFYVRNYRDGHLLSEDVTMEIYKVDVNGNDGDLLFKTSRGSQEFSEEGKSVYFFDFDVETETVLEL